MTRLLLAVSLALPVSLSAYAVREWWTLRQVDAAAEQRAASVTEHRQALTAACVADGGEPIVGELHVTCLRKWARHGESLVLWSRRKTP